jgi:selenocysteine lyase/cysteine desulfurase
MTSRVEGVATPAEIRAHFPALARVHRGQPVAYFDGPGGTQVPRVVGDALLDYLYHHNANTHWAYPTSAETDAALAHARVVLAAFLNATPDEIAFGNNMTTLTMHLARASTTGSSTGRISSAPSPHGPGCSRSAPPPTPWARSATWRRRLGSPGRRVRWCS